MARIKYYYDTETCKYERVKVKTSDVILNGLGILSLTIAMAAGLLTVYLYSNYFESPKELILKNEVKELEFYYEKLSKDVDHLRRKLYIESKSQDEVVALAEKKEKLYAAIPAIQPISNKQLLALSSGYGWRTHPIYKVKKLHPGIDFAASIGTPIYATADGTIDHVSVKFSGYGKMVEIDHGFGYRTRYAHMHGFAVRSGQNVKRGDLIGYVGNTGMSTAPHLHYEVFINGQHVDPVHYFYNDLSPAEYEKVLELASIENQSLGM